MTEAYRNIIFNRVIDELFRLSIIYIFYINKFICPTYFKKINTTN
jgi:hypothetical protein